MIIKEAPSHVSFHTLLSFHRDPELLLKALRRARLKEALGDVGSVYVNREVIVRNQERGK